MKLSIIIPVFNKEKFLTRCFDSILSQMEHDDNSYEILVVDDGSTDNSSAIINEYSAKYNLFRVITQTNSGVSIARNVAINAATGSYILFLDADDELIDGSLSKIMSYLSVQDVDMLVTVQTRNNGYSERIINIRGLEEGLVYSGVKAYRNQYVRTSAGGGICRTKFLRDHKILFPEGVRNSEDTIFFGLVQTYAKSIVYLNIPLYRIHEITGSASRVSNDCLAVRYIDAINAIINIRDNLKCSLEQKGIFEFYVFQLISNLINFYASSKNLGFLQLSKIIDFPSILPIDTRYMCIMKKKALLLNFSYRMYYFISYLIHK